MRASQIEAINDIEALRIRLDELSGAAAAVIVATDDSRKMYGGTISFSAAVKLDRLNRVLHSPKSQNQTATVDRLLQLEAIVLHIATAISNERMVCTDPDLRNDIVEYLQLHTVDITHNPV